VQEHGSDSRGSGHSPVTVCCEQGNESSGFITGFEFLDQMRDYQLLNKDSAQSNLLVIHVITKVQFI